MPSIWGLKPTTSIEDDREVRLSTGVTISLSDVNLRLGRKPNAQQLALIKTRVQATMDDVRALSSLEDGDPDKTATEAELLATYGGRMFLDGQGNIVSRATKFSLAWADGQLVSTFTEVR